MNLNVIMFSLATVLTMGCSSAEKKSSEKSAASVPQPTATKNETEAKSAPAAAPAATPATHAASSDHSMTCSLAKDTRKVELESMEPNGCKVFYTKSGNKSEIASSISGKNHCEEVSERVRKNLESSGFNCSGDKSENRATASAAKPSPAKN